MYSDAPAKRRLTLGVTAVISGETEAAHDYFAGIEKAARDYDVNIIDMTETADASLPDDAGVIARWQKKTRFMRQPLIDGLIVFTASFAAYGSEEQFLEQIAALHPLPLVTVGTRELPHTTAIMAQGENCYECGYTAVTELLSHLANPARPARSITVSASPSPQRRAHRLQPSLAQTAAGITYAAVQLAAAQTHNELKNALRLSLVRLGIPGIILALSDNATPDLETSEISLIIPDPPEKVREHLPYRITDMAHIPPLFFPAHKRFSLTLDLLCHAERYFGFAFMPFSRLSSVAHTSIRALLSQALYQRYCKEGRLREHSLLLNTAPLKSVLVAEDATPHHNTGKRMSKAQITSYLLDHINEMTNLDKMASDLGVSKSKLVRQTKMLTGYSVQVLHERLKMELAKELLIEGRLKLSEIAEQLGFQNGNYFSNVFKKNTGVSPRAWADARRI